MAGIAWLLALYSLVFVLHLIVPGRWVEGYVKGPEGHPLRYRLNGLRVFLVVIAAYVGACRAGLLSWDVLYVHRWAMLATACAVGLLFTFAIVLSAAPLPGASFFAELYLGRRENPQWRGGLVDAKMFLYLIGAVMLELNILSFAAHQIQTFPESRSAGVVLYTGLFSFFLVEYLFFERVHLYTYDFFAERVGFKLGWGCLVFYPFFYCIGLWSVADRPSPGRSPAWLAGSAVLFFMGWMLARGANMQKFYFKTEPDKRAFGFIAPASIEADGKRILVNGFWGLSRHINYLGEILMASGLTLSLGYPGDVWPWLYPLYYVALLVPRQHQDDKRCAQKYGAAWDEYKRRVPWRIVPWVY